jgi:TolA-binding protein
MGAQNLLKLGVSLAGMNQRELACATFAEIPNKYPDMSNAVRDKIAAEQKATNCTVN